MTNVLAELRSFSRQLVARSILVGQSVISVGSAQTPFNRHLAASRLPCLARCGTGLVLRHRPGQAEQHDRENHEYLSHCEKPPSLSRRLIDLGFGGQNKPRKT